MEYIYRACHISRKRPFMKLTKFGKQEEKKNHNGYTPVNVIHRLGSNKLQWSRSSITLIENCYLVVGKITQIHIY